MSQKANAYLNADQFERAKMDLKLFVDDVRALRATDLDSGQFQSMYKRYQRLYSSYQTFSEEQINQNFEPQDVKIIEVLALGAQAEKGFNEIIGKIQSDAGQTAVAVAQFIKTRSGFDLVHAKASEKYSEEELVHFFGSLLGVRITKECVGQLASERLGSIIGYALSGRCTEDMKEYQKLKQKEPNIELVDFLKQKIAQSDHEMLMYEESIKGQVYVHAMVNEHKGSPAGAVRASHRADHCFVKHPVLDAQGNVVEKGRLVVGLSTNAKDMQLQGKAFFKTLMGSKLLTGQKEYAGRPNPYHGYEVEPFYFMGGRYVANEPLKEGQKNEIGRDFLAQLKRAEPQISIEQLNNLAQMPFFALIANAQNARQCAQLLQFNSFIAGADTFDIYEQQQKALAASNNGGSVDESFLATFLPFVGAKVGAAIDTLVSRNVSLENAGREQLSLIVSDLSEISKRLTQNFAPVIDEQVHQKVFVPLADKLLQLSAHLWEEGHNDYGNMLKDLKKSARALKDWEQVQEEVQENLGDFKRTIKWDHSVEQGLSQRVFNDGAAQKVDAQLTHEQASKVVVVGEYLWNEAAQSGVSRYLQNFVQNYQQMLRTSVESQKVPDVEQFMGIAGSTFKTYTSSAISALKEQGATDLADWMAHSRQLLRTEPATDNRMKKANGALMKLVDEVYPLAQYMGVTPVPSKAMKA